jgi:hypothetical protein
VPDLLIQSIAASPLPTWPCCPKNHRERKFLIDDDDFSLLCTEVCDNCTSNGELQSARVARNIWKKKKKGRSIFQKCFNLINDQIGGNLSQKKAKNQHAVPWFLDDYNNLQSHKDWGWHLKQERREVFCVVLLNKMKAASPVLGKLRKVTASVGRKMSADLQN